jgi:hypothetical protein
MTRDSFMEFREAVEADLDAALDRFINEGRPDFDRIILEASPTDWTLGDPDLEPTWSDL